MNRNDHGPRHLLPSSILLAACIALFCIPVALTAQTLQLGSVPGLYYQKYSSDSDFSRSFEFSVSKNGQGTAVCYVTVDDGLGNSFDPRYALYGANRIAYYIYDNLSARNILKSGAGVTVPNVVVGQFTNPKLWYETINKEYSIFVPAGQFLPLGKYVDSLTFSLYAGTPGSGTFVASHVVPIELVPERYLGVRLAPPGGTYESGTDTHQLNFGSLSQGLKKEADMVVSSTIYFDVSFSSPNGGYLKRQGGNDDAPYVFRVDNSVVNLKAHWILALKNEAPTVGGERSYRIQVEIGDVVGLKPGVYKDSITITVTSR